MAPRWLTESSQREMFSCYVVCQRADPPSSLLTLCIFLLLRHLIDLCYPVPGSKMFGTDTAAFLFQLL